jgi:hypothetical protein
VEPSAPPASAFFASPIGVAVYITVGGRTIRVEFDSVESEGAVSEAGRDGAVALAVARRAFREHRAELSSLFTIAEQERRR